MLTLSPMTQDSFARYRHAAVRNYAEDNIACGRWPAEGALQRSIEDFAESLPQGLDTPDNYLYEIRSTESNDAVGILWFAVVTKNGIQSAFVYDIEINPEHRRRGYGRSAFVALELLVRGLGLSSIGLHVFGQNPGAQALYNSLGYGVTGINMLKHLGTSDA